MLKAVHPLLNADVLYALRQMGHGEDVVIADTNFPSEGIAKHTTFGRVLRIDADMPTVVRAVLSQFPLDTFVDDAACRMEVVGKPSDVLPIHLEVQQQILDEADALVVVHINVAHLVAPLHRRALCPVPLETGSACRGWAILRAARRSLLGPLPAEARRGRPGRRRRWER